MAMRALCRATDPNFRREEQSWTDHAIRKSSHQSSFHFVENDTEIRLCHFDDIKFGVPYRHYFLFFHPSEYIVEFHGNNGPFEDALFQIHSKKVMRSYNASDRFDFTVPMKDRLKMVENMSNYSLVLRNCEHLARFVLTGKWHSTQVAELSVDANALSMYVRLMTQQMRAIVNTPPRGLMSQPMEELKAEIAHKDKWEISCTNKDGMFTYPNEPDSFNVVFIGPTGSGKSNLINHIFGDYVAESELSAEGVTQAVKFYPGEYVTPMKKGKICLIDTVGFSDFVLTQEQMTDLVMSRLENQTVTVHRVVLVFGERMRSAEAEALQKYRNKFKFTNFAHLFSLVLTKCDEMDIAKQNDYKASFQDNAEAFGHFNKELVGWSIFEDKTVRMPLTVCVGLKDIRSCINSYSKIVEQRRLLLQSVFHFPGKGGGIDVRKETYVDFVRRYLLIKQK